MPPVFWCVCIKAWIGVTADILGFLCKVYVNLNSYAACRLSVIVSISYMRHIFGMQLVR